MSELKTYVRQQINGEPQKHKYLYNIRLTVREEQGSGGREDKQQEKTLKMHLILANLVHSQSRSHSPMVSEDNTPYYFHGNEMHT